MPSMFGHTQPCVTKTAFVHTDFTLNALALPRAQVASAAYLRVLGTSRLQPVHGLEDVDIAIKREGKGRISLAVWLVGFLSLD
jgi:hypothetical protein